MTTTVDRLHNWLQSRSPWFHEMTSQHFSLDQWYRNFGLGLSTPIESSDVLLVHGPINAKFAQELKQKFFRMPRQKWVIAMGSEAISGFPFCGPTTIPGLQNVIPVDLHWPTYPPNPAEFQKLFIALKKLILKGKNKPATSEAIPRISAISQPVFPGGLRTETYQREGDQMTALTFKLGMNFRGIEYLCQQTPLTQIPTLLQSADSLGVGFLAHAFCECIETLSGIQLSDRAHLLRIVQSELDRVQVHLETLSRILRCLGDVDFSGEMMGWSLQLRELRFMNSWSSKRQRTIEIGGVTHDISFKFHHSLNRWMRKVREFLKKAEDILENHSGLMKKTRGIGGISKDLAMEYGLSGPNLRATGVRLDRRSTNSFYHQLQFEIEIGTDGDTFDRFWVRFRELNESLRIVAKILKDLPYGRWKADDRNIQDVTGEIATFVESPWGLTGVYFSRPRVKDLVRIRIRSPQLSEIQLLESLLPGQLESDSQTVIASFNPTPEMIDR